MTPIQTPAFIPDPTINPATMVSRRTFLVLCGGALITLQTGCSTGRGKSKHSSGKQDEFPFDFWTGMRSAVRSSSDHTRAAADRAVATGDVATIFAFVRDQIALYPPPPGAYDPSTAIRWGTDATLRCGAGTLREKADVLVELYRRAGFQTELLQDTYAFPMGDADPYAPPVRIADPKLDRADVARWRKQLGLPPVPASRPPFDAGGKESSLIADAVLAALGSVKPQTGDPAGPSSGPIVKVTVAGKANGSAAVYFAIPVAGAELLTTLRVVPTTPAGKAEAPRITVSLAVSTRDAPDKLIEVVQHQWPADQVVGRQVIAQFVPPFGFDDLLGMKVRDVNLFVPTLTVRRPGDDAKTVAVNVITSSTAVTFTGNIVEDKTGQVTIDGQPVKVARDTSAGRDVARLEVGAQALHFPTVELVVTALDPAGMPIDALPPAAFSVRESNTAVAVLTRRNASRPPRVLVIYDGSLSVGSAFFEASGKKAFGAAFAMAAAAAIPAVELAVSGTDGNPPANTWVPAEPTAFATEMGGADLALSSTILRSVQAAKAAQPAVVVLVTDGVDDNVHVLDDGQLRADIAAGAPVVAVSVATADRVDQTTMDTIASLTRGLTVTARTPTDVGPIVAAVVKLLERQKVEPYRLTYDAPLTGPAKRTVTVSVGPTVTATTSYEVPAPEHRTVRPGIAGIHLTVTVGSENPITRTLAGVPPDTRSDNPLPADIDARIRNGLWGVHVISIEGAAPSLSTWIDDHTTGLLASRALWEGAQRNDAKAMRSGLEEGITLLPVELIGLHAPLKAPAKGEPATYERLFRVALVTHQPNFGKPGGPVRRGDILPLTVFETTGVDRVKAFRTTLRQSARLAVAERAQFDTSSAQLLDGATLVATPNGLPSSFRLSAADTARWNHLVSQYPGHLRVVPASGKPISLWAVDPRTGSLLGVLDDGSGGGRSGVPATAHAASAAAPCIDDLSDQAFNALGALGGGVYAAVGKACARIFARAARTLTTGPVPDTGDPNDILRDAACDIAKDATFGRLGKVGEIAGPIDDMADMFGKDLNCPGLSPTGPGGRPTC